MRRMKLMAVLGLLLAGGCGGGGAPATVPLQDLPPVPAAQAPTETQQGQGGIEALGDLRKPLQDEFLPADKADQCPMVSVTTPDGRSEELQPGRAGFVTIVVVWSMDTRQGKAAVLHVNELANKYAHLGVRAVSVVEPTEMAASAVDFAGAMQLRMPLYFDDLKQHALRKLAGGASASDRSAFPAIFVIDRRLRLRFYRPGFRYSMWSVMDNGRKIDHWAEDLPQDQTIEYDVTQILAEKW